MRALPLGVCAALAGTAHAQRGIGPIECFDLANDRLDDSKALQLCQGAINDIPARCYQRASDQILLSDELAIPLCAQATSEAPLTCALELDAQNRLIDEDIVSYCVAQPYPTAMQPGPGSPACLDAANELTNLDDSKQLALCGGSRDTAPVQCYLAGLDRFPQTVDDDLIQLCATLYIYTPQGVGGGY